MNLKVTIEDIGPERAAELLKLNTDNYRKISIDRVNAYAADMKNGKWEFNGETIAISETNKLKNGQHRLSAIIKAGVTVKMLVVYGVSDDATVYDVAQTRSGRQIALASGLSPSCSQASVIAAARYVLTPKHKAGASPTGTIVDYVKQHANEFEKAYTIARVGSHNSICRLSPCVAAIYCFLRLGKDEELLNDFFTVVNSGFQSDYRESSSAIVVRNTILSPRNRAKSRYLENNELFSTVLLAFQDFEVGRARKKAYRPDFDFANSITAKVRYLDEVSKQIITLDSLCG